MNRHRRIMQITISDSMKAAPRARRRATTPAWRMGRGSMNDLISAALQLVEGPARRGADPGMIVGRCSTALRELLPGQAEDEAVEVAPSEAPYQRPSDGAAAGRLANQCPQ